MRQAPGEWRKEVLAAAGVVPLVDRQTLAPGSSFPELLKRLVHSLLWPHPAAWAGLATIWLFIFAVNFSIRDRSSVTPERTMSPSPEVLAELRQQQHLFVELMGETDSKDPGQANATAPKSRSERTDISTT